MKYFAELSQTIRQKFMTKAKELDDALAEAYEESKHSRKSKQITLSRKYTRKVRVDEHLEDLAEKDEADWSTRCRRRPMCKLSLEEKIEIIH